MFSSIYSFASRFSPQIILGAVASASGGVNCHGSKNSDLEKDPISKSVFAPVLLFNVTPLIGAEFLFGNNNGKCIQFQFYLKNVKPCTHKHYRPVMYSRLDVDDRINNILHNIPLKAKLKVLTNALMGRIVKKDFLEIMKDDQVELNNDSIDTPAALKGPIYISWNLRGEEKVFFDINFGDIEIKIECDHFKSDILAGRLNFDIIFCNVDGDNIHFQCCLKKIKICGQYGEPVDFQGWLKTAKGLGQDGESVEFQDWLKVARFDQDSQWADLQHWLRGLRICEDGQYITILDLLKRGSGQKGCDDIGFLRILEKALSEDAEGSQVESKDYAEHTPIIPHDMVGHVVHIFGDNGHHVSK